MTNELMFQAWSIFGILCVVAELLVPGLVVIFIGLASFTVALGIHFSYLENLFLQFVAFAFSSLFYLFTLRLLLLRFIPSDTIKEDIDEDRLLIGQIVEVTETIFPQQAGRIWHSESTWPARSSLNETILKGEKAKIIGRDNITFLVQKIEVS